MVQNASRSHTVFGWKPFEKLDRIFPRATYDFREEYLVNENSWVFDGTTTVMESERNSRFKKNDFEGTFCTATKNNRSFSGVYSQCNEESGRISIHANEYRHRNPETDLFLTRVTTISRGLTPIRFNKKRQWCTVELQKRIEDLHNSLGKQ